MEESLSVGPISSLLIIKTEPREIRGEIILIPRWEPLVGEIIPTLLKLRSHSFGVFKNTSQ